MSIKLLIDGADLTNYLYYGQSVGWNLMRGSRGSCNLPLIIGPGDLTAPQVGAQIEIYDPSTTRAWKGSADAVTIHWIGDDGWHILTLTGVSIEQVFDTAEVPQIEYTNENAGSIVADLLTRSGTGITAGTISSGPVVKSLQVTNIAQGFSALALLAGFVWYVDPEDAKLYFHLPGARAAAFSLASTDVLWETLEWKQSRADFRDTQVIQLPGIAQSPVSATFAGDGTATSFTLPSVPSYLVSTNILPNGRGSSSINWNPGQTAITVTPAMAIGSSLVVEYADAASQVIASNSLGPAIGIGAKAARYTGTRTFTSDGALQEATAMLARYSMLPSSLSFQTDKPGIGIARALTIALDHPLEASGVLNGVWLVQELDASVLPGLDMRDEPWGHFRYTVRLVNTAATAIYPGDGSTTLFLLPEIPTSAPGLRIANAATVHVAGWVMGTNQVNVTPAMADGESLIVTYNGANAPDVPTFMATWENMPGPGSGGGDQGTIPPSALAPSGPPAVFIARLTIFDTTVGDDIAPHTPVHHAGIALRLLGVLRKSIGSDLSIRINKNNIELITVTVPLATAVDDVLEWSLAQGSPAVLGPFYDKEVLTADILESDGSTDANGVAQFTVEWTLE